MVPVEITKRLVKPRNLENLNGRRIKNITTLFSRKLTYIIQNLPSSYDLPSPYFYNLKMDIYKAPNDLSIRSIYGPLLRALGLFCGVEPIWYSSLKENGTTMKSIKIYGEPVRVETFEYLLDYILSYLILYKKILNDYQSKNLLNPNQVHKFYEEKICSYANVLFELKKQSPFYIKEAQRYSLREVVIELVKPPMKRYNSIMKLQHLFISKRFKHKMLIN